MRLSYTVLVVSVLLLAIWSTNCSAHTHSHRARTRARILGRLEELAPDATTTNGADTAAASGAGAAKKLSSKVTIVRNSNTLNLQQAAPEDVGAVAAAQERLDRTEAELESARDQEAHSKTMAEADKKTQNREEEETKRHGQEARKKEETKEASNKKVESEKRAEEAAKKEEQALKKKEEEDKKSEENTKKNAEETRKQEEKTKHQAEQNMKQEQQHKVQAESEQKAKAEERAKKEAEEKKKRERVLEPAQCVAWGDPHYVTFDGNKYDWYAEGEYVLATDPDFDEQVNTIIQKPHSQFPVAYNTGVALKSGNSRAGIQFEKPRSQFDPHIFLDGKEYEFHQGATYKAGDLELISSWSRGGNWAGKKIATLLSKKSGTKVDISVNQHHAWGEHMVYMDVTVHYAGRPAGPARTGGMCGRYDKNPNNDYMTPQGQAVDAATMVRSWQVAGGSTLFTYHPRVTAVTAQDVRNARKLSPLELAGGNQAVVDQAAAACAQVPADVRDSCMIDFIAGGGADVAKEAAKVDKKLHQV